MLAMEVVVELAETQAGMAELADAADSKSAEGNLVGVRPPLPAPSKIPISSVNQRLAALILSLGFGIFWVDAALRYDFRCSAHPLSFQYLGPACGGLYFC
jgi:hypothetical protein